MNEKIRKEALENIEMIKNLVFNTKQEMSHYGGGWISIIWGIYCFAGFSGHRWLMPKGIWEGIWWMGLSLIGIFASILVIKKQTKNQSREKDRKPLRWFFWFWMPLLVLAYTLCLLVAFTPGISEKYITIFILLVISTGYTILGLMFFREILFMGIIGFVSTSVAAVFFLPQSDIILSILFGTGLIITGLIINKKWRY
jgi:hypothetical protein